MEGIPAPPGSKSSGAPTSSGEERRGKIYFLGGNIQFIRKNKIENPHIRQTGSRKLEINFLYIDETIYQQCQIYSASASVLTVSRETDNMICYSPFISDKLINEIYGNIFNFSYFKVSCQP